MSTIDYREPEEDREQATRLLLRRWERWILIFLICSLLGAAMICGGLPFLFRNL